MRFVQDTYDMLFAHLERENWQWKLLYKYNFRFSILNLPHGTLLQFLRKALLFSLPVVSKFYVFSKHSEGFRIFEALLGMPLVKHESSGPISQEHTG